MKKPWHAAIWGGVVLLLFVLLAGCTDGGGGNDLVPANAAEGAARKIVVFDSTVSQTGQNAKMGKTRSARVKNLPLINATVVMATPADVQALLTQPGVLRVEDDIVVNASANPSARRITWIKPPPPPPAEALPWGVNKIDAELVWDANHDLVLDSGANTGAGVRVAVVDTGIDLDHPDLAANIAGGYNAISPSRNADDDNGHGTHVAGIIAALDNTVGVLGVAPQASLLAVKVLNRRGSGYLSDIIEGIQWSVNNGADVINMSLGTTSNVQSFHDAITAAYNAGVVVVAAAGNSGSRDNTVEYPAKYPEVIAVSATGTNNVIASFSSRGTEVELAAPGMNVPSTYMGGGLKTLSGTSMASPHVAGVAALIIASGVNGVENVRDRLHQTADDLGAGGKDNLYGYGLVDAEEAATGSQTNP